MIPKIIHYCWLSGDPYPDKIKHCIESWHKYLPDYEFILWDRKKFNINSVPWVKQAFERKKYAFAADYIRAYALKNYGGIYLDSDVEVLKTFNDLLNLPYFMGLERFDLSNSIEAAVIGAEKNHFFFTALLNYYQNRFFIIQNDEIDITPLPCIFKKCIETHQFVIKKISGINQFDYSDNVISVFPSSFFSPKDNRINAIKVTSDTYTIHYFEGSWTDKNNNSFSARLRRIVGDKIYFIFIAKPFFFLKDYLIYLRLRNKLAKSK
jgi:mannosyltransferase OCH1-like enzyme